jgi:CTP-dependent riboflavin kinase
LFQYIKTLQGLTKEKWIKVDNVNSYKWFGLSQSTKWRVIKKLKDDNLILVRGSKGRAPLIKIIAPEKKLN